MDSPFHMWSYWRTKYGVVVALEAQYPETLKANPDLQLAVSTIKNAERAIDKFMEDQERDE